MANRRMIAKSISISEQVNDLNDFTALLFSWMIPHADDWGVLPGSAKKIKALVIPLRQQTPEEVENALTEMERVGLIWRYEADGTKYIQFKTWETHQEGLHKRSKPKFPLFKDVFPGGSENFSEIPGNSRSIEPNLKEKNLKEENLKKTDNGTEFTKFWNVYPRKDRRVEAMEAWVKIISNGAKTDELIAAAKQYAAKVKGTEIKFIKFPSNFLQNSVYRDYVPPPQQIISTPDPEPPTADVDAAIESFSQKREQYKRNLCKEG